MATTKIVNDSQALTYTNVAVVKADYNPKTGVGDMFAISIFGIVLGTART